MSKYTHQISRYLAGEMSPEEKKSFETLLHDNVDLMEEYKLIRLAQDVFVGEPDYERILKDPNLKEAEKIVEEWDKDKPGDGKTAQKDNITRERKLYAVPAWIWLAAASLAMLFLVVRATIIPQRAEKIFLAYYETIDPASIETSEVSPDILQEYQEAHQYFEEEKYALAASEFRNIIEYGTQYPDILLLLGISEMEMGELSDALEILTLAASIEGDHAQYAALYSGICHIKLGDPRAAIIYLADITGLTEQLGEGSQKLIKRVYLLYTFQFKKFRDEYKNDTPTDKMIGPTQKKIFFAMFAFSAILTIIVVLVVNRHRIRKNRHVLWLPFIFFLPIIGSIMYLLYRKK